MIKKQLGYKKGALDKANNNADSSVDGVKMDAKGLLVYSFDTWELTPKKDK